MMGTALGTHVTGRAGMDGMLPCDACDDAARMANGTGTQGDAGGRWECACASVPAYRCPDGDTARLCVNVRLPSGGADGEGGLGTGTVTCRLADPCIGMQSDDARELYASAAGSAADVSSAIVTMLMGDARRGTNVVAWSQAFGADVPARLLHGYGDWWRAHGAHDAIRRAIGDECEFDIDSMRTVGFPMRAHAIAYSDGGTAFEVFALLGGDLSISVSH